MATKKARCCLTTPPYAITRNTLFTNSNIAATDTTIRDCA
jgi:hypothetical protein